MGDEPTGITGEFEEEDWLIVHLNGFASGREYERKQIVAWLRDERREYPATEYSGFVAMIAEDIAAGTHLK